MSAQYPQPPVPQQPQPQYQPYQPPQRPHRQQQDYKPFNLFDIGKGGSWDFRKNGGLGNILNFGLLGLLNGTNPLLQPGAALLGAFNQPHYMHDYNYSRQPYQRPMVQQAPPPPTAPPPQQPGGY